MKRCFLFGILLVFLLFMENAYAEPENDLNWVRNDYVGVGAIDMQKLTDRNIYADLMAFFVTDPDAKQVLGELEKAGLNSKSLQRIVVGIPADVEKGEFIIFWELKDTLDKYLPVLENRETQLNKASYQNRDYFCVKNKNQCLLVAGNNLVYASELKLKGILDVYAGKADVEINDALVQTAKRADVSKDAWLAFSLDEVQRSRIGAADPLVDQSAKGKGQLKLGAVKSGTLSIDFSQGLRSEMVVHMVSQEAARDFSGIVNDLMRQGLNDQDIKSMELENLIKGLSLQAKADNLMITVNYSQNTFQKLISIVTDVVKSAAHDKPIEPKKLK